MKLLSVLSGRTSNLDEVTGQGSPRRTTSRRTRARAWGLSVVVALAALLGTSSAEVRGGAATEGGHHGTSSTGGAFFTGEGGSGPLGAPMQVGGEKAPLVCRTDDELDILFIGNSYTHYFDMPTLLEGMAESAGCRVNAEMVAPGGSRLKLHANYGETLAAIGSRPWDAVVLQNFSQLPSQPIEDVKRKTFPHVQKLVQAIRHNDPQTDIYFYVTWGRRDGDKDNCKKKPMVCSFRGHTEALHRGYSLYAETFGGDLVNVGGAWAKVPQDRRAPFSHRELYDPDGSHPSLKGSYLVASVFFTTLFKSSPEGLSYPQGLSETSARYIQRLAGSMPISGA